MFPHIKWSLGNKAECPLCEMAQHFGWDMAADVYTAGNTIKVKMHVAGVDPKKLDVSIEGRILRVSGERSEEKEQGSKNKGDYYTKEIRLGAFERDIELPCDVQANNITAEYQDGVLTILLPKK